MDAPGPASRLPLADGRSIPVIGLGTAPLDDDAAHAAVSDALRIGYRLIDTGAVYGNETGVGRALAEADLPREAWQVMTKVRGRDHGYDSALRAFEASRALLGVEFVDHYLIHWPLPMLDRYVDTWRALVRLRDDGLVRSIGVSNFTPAHIDRLVAETGVAPAVDQVEVHPRHPQEDLLSALDDRRVRTVAYSPLGRGDGLGDPALARIADRVGGTVAQVVLRWHVARGVVPVPRASGPARRRENLAALDVALAPEDVAAVTGALEPARTGFDPDEHLEL